MTPNQIATEAAIECIATMKERWLAHGLIRDSEVTALILTAAAKMVRESRALDALLSCSPMAEYPSEEWSRLSDAKFAALEKLRSITGKAHFPYTLSLNG